MASVEAEGGAQWLTRREKGSRFWITALVGFTRRFGRGAARGPLYLVAAWYVAFHPEVRRAAAAYHRRVGLPVGWRTTWRHVLTFAQVTLDRLYFLTGRTDAFRVSCNGIENLHRLKADGRGAILVGAHVGSFEAARLVGHAQDFPIHVLVHTRNARRINEFIATVAPHATLHVIEIDPSDRSYIFRVQEVIERGEFVAILGDRVGLNDKAARVEFLGSPAAFPTGVWALASALGCPVALTFGLHEPPDGYALYCEPLADRVVLPRKERGQALEAWARRYAERLESYVRRAPLNWFNFYDFWS